MEHKWPGEAPSASRPAPCPLSEVSASQLSRRPGHQASKLPAKQNVRGEAGWSFRPSVSIGSGPNGSRTVTLDVDELMRTMGQQPGDMNGKPWNMNVPPHEQATANGSTDVIFNGRRFTVKGAITRLMWADGRLFTNQLPVEQLGREHPRHQVSQHLAQHNARERRVENITPEGRVVATAATTFIPSSLLPENQQARPPSQNHTNNHSPTAVPSSQHSLPSALSALEDPFVFASHHQAPSEFARPIKLSPKDSSRGPSRYKLERRGSPGLHRPSAPARPIKLETKKPTLSAPRLKQEPTTSSTTRIAAVPATARPAPTQLKGESKDLSHSARLLDIPSVPSSPGEGSDSALDYDDGLAFTSARPPGALSRLKMEGFDVPGEASRPNAMEEIHRLLQLPDIDMPPDVRAFTPVQMSITLLEHQKVALKWLLEQEANPDKKGGLLADTMGLGKTIEALALIVANKPPASGPKTTLVVAPLALLRQWKREIKDKLKPAHQLSTFIYHGREKKTRNAARLYDYDVVITTYETIACEYNRVEPDGKRKSLLFTENARGFYRIILDEAHKIKNRNTSCSKAVCELRAEYRLCMTGTPFMNRTSEIFSLVRFLAIAPYCSWNHFNRQIETPLRKWEGDDQAEAMRRLQVLFRSITLRRTKDSVLDGKSILVLPKLTITNVTVELDADQRAYYVSTEAAQQRMVNKYLKHNRLNKVIAYILVLLTRLRQVCDHPYLTQSHGIPNEVKLSSKRMIQLATRFDFEVVNAVLKKKEFRCPLCEQIDEVPIIVYPCGHDLCRDCFSSMMQVGSQSVINAEQSQMGLIGFVGAGADMETKCPHDDCETDILDNKVVCHDFFLDAHGHGSASQGQQSDFDAEESDGFYSSGDEADEDEEDSDDDGEDLRDFIVSDGEEDSENGGEGSGSEEDGVGSDDQEKRPSHQKIDAGAEANEAETESESTVSSPDRISTPDPFSINDDEPQPSSMHQSSPSGGEVARGLDDAVPEFANDLHGRVFSQIYQKRVPGSEKKKQAASSNEAADLAADSDSDSDSDSDLGSLTNFVLKSRPKAAATAACSKPVTGKRKRGNASRTTLHPRKRAKNGSKKKAKKGKGKTMAQLKKIGSSSKAAKANYNERLRRDWETSAKCDTIIDLLREIREERPHEKTLVFSVWTSFLDLLEIPMQDEKFTYLRYDGGMTFNERDDNVNEFFKNPRENILLVSLMAGNAGLNLTMASQVIIVEPFWNPFVEDQAIDRAHRYGQKKEVHVHKLLVPDSVEDRILALQEKKRTLVNTALSEEGAQGAGRLSIGELRGLFGLR